MINAPLFRLSLLLFLLFALPARAETELPSLAERHAYTIGRTDDINALALPDNGMLVVAGMTMVENPPDWENVAAAFRTGADGETLWELVIPGELSFFTGGTALPDGRSALLRRYYAGTSMNKDNARCDLLIVGPDGAVENTYPVSAAASALAIGEDGGNVYVLEWRPDADMFRVGVPCTPVIACMDADTGDTLWERDCLPDGFFNAGLIYIAQAGDGGLLLLGYGQPDTAVFMVGVLMKVDAQGKSLWTARIPGDIPVTMIRDFMPMPDGGALVVGTRSVPAENVPEAHTGMGVALRVDGGGSILWEKTFFRGYGTEMKAVVPAKDGYLIAGQTNERQPVGMLSPTTTDDYWFLLLDERGETLAETIIPNLPDDHQIFMDGLVWAGDGKLLVYGIQHLNVFDPVLPAFDAVVFAEVYIPGITPEP